MDYFTKEETFSFNIYFISIPLGLSYGKLKPLPQKKTFQNHGLYQGSCEDTSVEDPILPPTWNFALTNVSGEGNNGYQRFLPEALYILSNSHNNS